jgi:ribosomal-protein-alanine N-acetyltransferase
LLEVLRRAMTENLVARVQLEVRPANRRAQRLYGRFGFVPVGVHRGFYDRADESGSTDAVVMVVADHRSPAWTERLERLDRSANAGAAR